MLGLNITTLCLEVLGTTGGIAVSAHTALDPKHDSNGKIEKVDINPGGAIASALATTATTGSAIYQECSERKVMEEINAAEAYVESLPDEQLEAMLAQIGDLEESATNNKVNQKRI